MNKKDDATLVIICQKGSKENLVIKNNFFIKIPENFSLTMNFPSDFIFQSQRIIKRYGKKVRVKFAMFSLHKHILHLIGTVGKHSKVLIVLSS